MKLVVLTDIHGKLRHLAAAEELLRAADTVLLPGDLTMFGKRAEVARVVELIRAVNSNVLAVMGNCDYPEATSYLDDEGLLLHRRNEKLNGLTFIGLGGSLPCPMPTLNEWSEEQISEYLAEAMHGVPPEATLVLMSHQKADALGLQPLARWVCSAAAGIDPRVMGLGPVHATRKALQRAGLKIDAIDLAELNEAFAVQALAVLRELNLREEVTNVNGGAIALGHPLGCSGARILTTLIHEMQRRAAAGETIRYGLATLCVGVGQGEATIVELCDGAHYSSH